MSLLEVLLIGVGLAMDAFAVSICKGMSDKNSGWKPAVIIALYFGIAQTVMPTIGYLLGISFEKLVKNVDHWIAFGLLLLIGANMIREAIKGDEEDTNDSIDVKTMVLLAIATSIDALAVGVTFAFLNINLLSAVSLIGIVTFIICVIGVKIGAKIGGKFGRYAGMVGGVVLIVIGTKILIEHLFFGG